MLKTRSGLLCASALVSVMGLYAAPAVAQDASLEEIVVTGSRIARQDYVSESPIVTVSRDQITAVGAVTVDSTLNQLPQFTPSNGQGTNTTNFVSTPGQAYANLRGLRPERTLVLIDGRRVVAANPNNVVDLNSIPNALIDNIETITGGASAVYGSDAIAGVVNFKLKKNFEGGEVDAQYGMTDRSDAEQASISIAYGKNIGDRGNVSGVFSWDKRQGVFAAEREWSEVGYSILTTGLTPSGAATILEGRFDPGSNSAGGSNLPSQAALDTVFGRYGVAAGQVARNSNIGFNADGTLFTASPVRNFRGEQTPGFSPTSYTFNSAQYRYLSFPLERFSVFGTGYYDLTDTIEAYGTVSFVTYDVSRQLGPASASDGAFPGPDIVVPVTNPFIPQDLRTLLASRASPNAEFYPRRAFSEVGGRLSENTYDTLQVVAGLRGETGYKDWKWDIYASFGRMAHEEAQFGNVSRAAMRQLTFAADGGVALCGGFNIFGAGKVSPGCAAFIARDVKNETELDQHVVEGNLTGSLFTLPAGDLKFSTGFQYRRDYVDYDPDLLLQGPDIVGFNPAVPIQGTIKSKEAYAELLVPLLDFDGGRKLDLSIAGRVADYNTVGAVYAYKADLTATPFEGVLLRGGIQRAVRAPNIAELYSPVSLGFVGIGTPGLGTTAGDPCDVRSSFRRGPNGAAVRALCLAQGMPSALVDIYNQPSTQVEALSGGNPDLKEESSESITAGAVWQPKWDTPWARRLQVSVDYFRIDLKDVVGSLSTATILGNCFNTEGGNPTFSDADFYCGLFERLGTTGAITNLQLNQINLSHWRESGVDFQLDWGVDLVDFALPERAGRFDVNFVLSHIYEFKQQSRPGQPFFDFNGTIGGGQSGAAYPRWKWTSNFTWSSGPVRATFRWRHIDSMLDARNIPVFSPTAVNPPTYDAYDLVGWYDVNERIVLRAGVNNLTDKDPPLFTSASNSNTDPSAYDILGRRYFMGLNVKF